MSDFQSDRDVRSVAVRSEYGCRGPSANGPVSTEAPNWTSQLRWQGSGISSDD
jgi:hypothetical protein